MRLKLRDALFLTAGILLGALAVLSPLDALAERLFSAHMVQHMVLVLGVAPAIARGRPVAVMIRALPSRARRGASRAFVRLMPGPLLAAGLSAVALWTWHLPRLHDAALADPVLHSLEHLTLTGFNVMFWSAILHGRRGRLGYGVAVLCVFVTAVHTTVLAALLTFAPRPWFPVYAGTEGLTPLEDQQLAGLIMWVPGGIVLTAAALALMVSWLRASDHRARAREALSRATLGFLAVIVVGATVTGCGVDDTGRDLTGGDPARGRIALRAYGCWTCHTIPGIPGANAVVGPPLSRIAVRAFVAGQPNTPDNLIRFIQHPQQARRSTPMPEVDVSDADARNIAAYLYTLR